MKHHHSQPSTQAIWTMAVPPKDRLSHYGPPLLISQEEAAHRLGISRTTVWRLLRNGDLDAVPIGARTLITYRSVEDFISRLRRVGTPTSSD